ncbi:MAG: hypothetical protein HY744_14740 [Deltaproteobacteria bacterium]|nr:hypothetical protein [Deltaproteobacteria bacterium]
MQRNHLILAFSLLLFCACGPEPAPPEVPATPAAAPSPKPGPKPEPTAAPSPKPEPAPLVAPVLPKIEDTARSDAPAELKAAAELLGQKQWQKAKDELAAKMKEIDRRGALDVRAQAHAMMGQAQAMLGDVKEADREYRKVLPLWDKPREAAKKLMALEKKDEAAGKRRVAYVVDATGEALFYLAEKSRARAEEKPFPDYAGAGEPNDLDHHVSKKVRGWLDVRLGAVRKAQEEYARIEALKPEPPPKWSIVAASRRGAMHAVIVHAFRTTPLPAEWKDKQDASPYKAPEAPVGPVLTWEQVRTRYRAALRAAMEPLVPVAVEAYTACQQLSAKHGRVEPFSKSCDDWLKGNAAASAAAEAAQEVPPPVPAKAPEPKPAPAKDKPSEKAPEPKPAPAKDKPSEKAPEPKPAPAKEKTPPAKEPEDI